MMMTKRQTGGMVGRCCSLAPSSDRIHHMTNNSPQIYEHGAVFLLATCNAVKHLGRAHNQVYHTKWLIKQNNNLLWHLIMRCNT